MARYNLNANEVSILTSWLFEEGGYLDSAINASGVSARQARAATPSLDVTAWIRTNSKGAATSQDNWDDCAMVWWMRANDNVNVTPQTVPAEKAAWVTKLQGWDASIADAFIKVSQAARDGQNVPITTENGTTTNRPAGQQLVQQRSLFGKVIPVLQQ
jgi:hypothetical protein